MKLYSQRIIRSSIPRAEYKTVIRKYQQAMLRKALGDAGLLSEAGSSTLLSPALSAEIDTPRISHGPHGKPYLTDYPDCHYNFTDSGDWLVLAISETGSEIGVDLQKVVPVRAGIMPMARRFFHPDDVALLEKAQSPAKNSPTEAALSGLSSITDPSPDPQTRLFFRIWTVKEAYLKFTGEGLSGGMNRYPVDFINKKIGAASFMEAAPPEPGYYLTACVK